MYINKLICSRYVVLLAVQRSVFAHHCKKTCTEVPTVFIGRYSGFIGIRKMSQRSITSFFKSTPKQESEIKEVTKIEDESPTTSPAVINEVTPKTSPVSNRKVKGMSKRQRFESSDSEGSPPGSKPDAAVHMDTVKKKPKRQRIESSDSEAEVPSPQEKHEPQVKLETQPKTYSSPKTKKIKVEKTESPKLKSPVKMEKSPSQVKSKVENSPTEVDKSPLHKTSPKLEKVKSPLMEKNKKAKSPKSGKKDMKGTEKKIEKVPEKPQKNAMSFFIRKDNKEEDKTPAGGVPEEEYDPSKPKYDPIADACWAPNQEVPYLALARTLERIEATSGRLKIIDTLANYLRSVIALSVDALVPSIYLCLNQVAPAYHGLELGIAETYLMKAIAASTGSSLSQVRLAVRKEGDLGTVAQAARGRQTTMLTPKHLTLHKVFSSLKEISLMCGPSSVQTKISRIQTLYIACRDCEAKYLIRSLEGKLRIGLAEQSVLQALAVAVTLTPPKPGGGALQLDASKNMTTEQYKSELEETALTIKSTYCECPNYEEVIPSLVQYGVKALPQHCSLRPGVPLRPMLAQPTKGVHEVFSRFDKDQFTCEWKYDGERTQLHVPELADGSGPQYGAANAYSRSQEPQNGKYPDVLARLPAFLGPRVKSCVLDAEAVAVDPNTNQILPFQVLSTRKRKEGTGANVAPTVAVAVFVFDLLYLNGRALVREPLAERRRLLREHFNEVTGQWQFAMSRDCSTEEEVQLFLEESVKGSCEGLMVKTLTGAKAHYQIARRSRNWLKLKKDYLEGCGDSIDAVVIGAYEGKGKRGGRFGGFLLACRDDDSDEYQTLCRIGTGFSDQDLASITDRLRECVIETPPAYYRYDPCHCPDVWVSAKWVWEVRCADLSLSPAHRAATGLVNSDRGVSLRFPRFVRERDDKRPEQCTTARQIADMYLAQDQVKNTANANANANDAEDDFY